MEASKLPEGCGEHNMEVKIDPSLLEHDHILIWKKQKEIFTEIEKIHIQLTLLTKLVNRIYERSL